jgi:hypothetical protein
LNKARGALAGRLTERAGRDRVTDSDYARATQGIDAIREKHSGIASAFGSDNGVEIQFRDSEIIREVISACAKEGIPALPVNDEVIMPERYEGRLSEIMIRAFEQRVPGPNKPKLKASYLESEPNREPATDGKRSAA